MTYIREWTVCETQLQCARRVPTKIAALRMSLPCKPIDMDSSFTSTHWGWDKMTAIFAYSIFSCILLNEKVWISIEISMKFVPECVVDNIRALVQIMVWHRGGDKPLSEVMMALFTDAYMHHSALMGLNKMSDIVIMTFSNAISWSKHLNFDPIFSGFFFARGPVDNKPSLV